MKRIDPRGGGLVASDAVKALISLAKGRFSASGSNVRDGVAQPARKRPNATKGSQRQMEAV